MPVAKKSAEGPKIAPLSKELTEAMDAPPAQGWRPEKGDRLGGKLIDIYVSGPGKYGEYPILEILQSNNVVVAVHAFHTVLREAIARRNPQIGDTVVVGYNGKLTSGGATGEGYEDYRLIVRKAV